MATVGLSILLETHHHHHDHPMNMNKNGSTQILSKFSLPKPQLSPPPPPPLPLPASSSSNYSSSLPSITFLDSCFLCKKSLLPGKDIYMYRGDRAFCSVECRCKQIFLDETKENCGFNAVKPISSSSSSPPRHRRERRN